MGDSIINIDRIKSFFLVDVMLWILKNLGSFVVFKTLKKIRFFSNKTRVLCTKTDMNSNDGLYFLSVHLKIALD